MTDLPFTDNIVRMYRTPNLSMGVGLMYRWVLYSSPASRRTAHTSLDPIRVEINFSMPIVGYKGERLSRGFGVGLGLEFL